MANKVKIPSIDLSALSDISSVVTGAHNPDLNTKNGYFEINLSKIAEDPNQPRREFDVKAIEELAQSIEENGLKQPIAIRNDPDRPGRFIICQGARRFRAYGLKGWKKIPAVFDPRFSRAGQVIENIQRQPLTPEEIAEYIKEELNSGKSIRQIAKGLGKSPAFVFLYKNLLEIKPDAVRKAWEAGRVGDIQALNDLLHLAKNYEREVAAFISESAEEITRPSVKALKRRLEGKEPERSLNEPPPAKRAKQGANGKKNGSAKASLFVSFHGQTAVLILKQASSEKNAVIEVDGKEKEVPIGELSLLRVSVS